MNEKEEARLSKLKEYEKKLFDSGIKYIAGIDEAGRGPLAGPVVVRSSHTACGFIYRRNK
ncbi:MAG: hypothetical protein FWC53_04175 [Firmicutes bacterium]|nr:hypothetical protein [Bacillota bacterium]